MNSHLLTFFMRKFLFVSINTFDNVLFYKKADNFYFINLGFDVRKPRRRKSKYILHHVSEAHVFDVQGVRRAPGVYGGAHGEGVSGPQGNIICCYLKCVITDTGILIRSRAIILSPSAISQIITFSYLPNFEMARS